jgi:hypothetical protein
MKDVLSGVDKVIQAPMRIIVDVLHQMLLLSPLERLVLPYLLAGGCADMQHGGNYTMGLDPRPSAEVTIPRPCVYVLR